MKSSKSGLSYFYLIDGYYTPVEDYDEDCEDETGVDTDIYAENERYY